jgi:hypothetical protein
LPEEGRQLAGVEPDIEMGGAVRQALGHYCRYFLISFNSQAEGVHKRVDSAQASKDHATVSSCSCYVRFNSDMVSACSMDAENGMHQTQTKNMSQRKTR